MKFKINQLSIKWKIFLFFFMFAVVVLIFLWVFQVVFLDDFYKSIKIKEIRSSALGIEKNIENKDIESLVFRLAQNNNICISIYDNTMTKQISADILPDCIIHKLPDFGVYTLYQQASQNGGEYLERFKREEFKNETYSSGHFIGIVPGRDQGMSESIVYTKIIKKADGTQHLLLLNSTISPVNATVNTIRTQLMIVTIIMIVLALILAFIISKLVSKPIVKINNSAKVLATGNYDVQFNGTGYREIAELSQTLNYAAKELSKVEGLRRELIANISHDLRTPLTMISGYSEVMRDVPGENTPENIQIIIDESKHLAALVNDVLDISKFQSGTQKLNLSEFNLTKTIHEILNRYTKLIKQDGYQIEFLYDREILVTADELRITQVVYNLINNAITYTGEDKKVIVKQTIKDNAVTIEVIDTGEGIAPENLKFVWERYYKVDKTHRRAQIGTGLGLSIVKNILEMHHAQYGVISQIGEGSNFWFTLPINQS